MKKIKSETLFIDIEDKAYVQKPTSVMGGWARAVMMKRVLRKPVHIAGDKAWHDLTKKYRISTLIEFSDGSFFVNLPDE